MERRVSPPFFTALIIFTTLIIAPIVVMVATTPPASVASAFSSEEIRAASRVSFLASLLAVAIAALLGVPAGYELARRRERTRTPMLFLLALPLAFPPVASGILLLNVLGARSHLGSWLATHGIRLVDSFGGVVAAEFFVSASFVAIASCAAFRALDTVFEEAAATLGASRVQSFLHVALPLAAPNVIAGILLAWLRAIGEYGATSVVAYHPTSLPVALYVALSADGVQPALALAYGFMVLAALIVAVQWAVRRHVV